MITEKNVIDLVKYYDEEDFFKAFDYALKSIRCTFNRMGVPANKIYRRIQNIVKGIIAERVFEKFLKDKNISFNLKGRTLWYKVDQNDFIINEHTCDVKSLFIDINQNFYERNFKTLDNHEKLERFVDVCDFLIPQDQFTSKTQKKKYYISCITEGTFNTYANNFLAFVFHEYEWWKRTLSTQGEIDEYYLNHIDPILGKIKIEVSENNKNLVLRLRGIKTKNSFEQDIFHFNEGNIQYSKNDYNAVYSLEVVSGDPTSKISIESEKSKLKKILNPNTFLQSNGERHWYSYSFLAKAIYLMGYINWIEVQEKGQLKPRFSKDTGIMQDTQIDNMAIKNKFLHPIEIIGKSE